MQAQPLQSVYNKGVIRDLPRHMLPSGSVWSMYDFIADLEDGPLQKRGGWGAGPTLTGAAKLNAVAFAQFGGTDAYCVIDDRGHLWRSPIGYFSTVLASSPSLYWRLDENLSGPPWTAKDASGHGHEGTYSGVGLNQPGAPIGDSDKAISFTGAGSIVTANGYNPFVVGSKRTFMGWANRSIATNPNTLMGQQQSSGGLPLGVSLQVSGAGSPADVLFTTGTSTIVTWTGAWPNYSAWHFWVLTYDDSTKIAELFIDGVSKGTKTLDAGYSSTARELLLGARMASDGSVQDTWRGPMDEFAVFESKLASSTITNIYNASTTTWTDEGAAVTTKQRPVFFNSKLVVLPDGVTYTTPKKFDGATISNLAMTGLTGVTPLWGVSYKSRLVIADTQTLYFSNVVDAETYDVDSFVKATYPITGLAALPNMIAIFSSGHVERLRGTTPPSSNSAGDMSLEPMFAEGCVDARSIVVYQDQMIWANLNGVHMSDGAGYANLTEQGGIQQYWHDLMQSRSSNWVFAGGIFKGRYVLAITDGTGTFVAGFVCELASKTWTFFNNLPVAMFSESLGATTDLVMALSNQNFIGYFASCFDPTSGDADGNGFAVQPSIELPFYRPGMGQSRIQDLFLGLDLEHTGAEVGDLEIYYTTSPDSDAYTQLVDDAGNPITLGATSGYSVQRIPVRISANGIGLKFAQVGASAKTILFELQGRIRELEGRF